MVARQQLALVVAMGVAVLRRRKSSASADSSDKSAEPSAQRLRSAALQSICMRRDTLPLSLRFDMAVFDVGLAAALQAATSRASEEELAELERHMAHRLAQSIGQLGAGFDRLVVAVRGVKGVPRTVLQAAVCALRELCARDSGEREGCLDWRVRDRVFWLCTAIDEAAAEACALSEGAPPQWLGHLIGGLLDDCADMPLVHHRLVGCLTALYNP